MEKSFTGDYRDYELGTDRFRILVKRLELLPIVPQKKWVPQDILMLFP